MGRILALDYGQKRVGIAVTDELQLIAGALTTVHVKDIFEWFAKYIKDEKIDTLVVGEPRQMNNTPSESVKYIEPFIKRFSKVYPDIEIFRYDERFTSVLAHRTMQEAGLNKKKMNNKEMIDSISAVLILQSFLQSRSIK
jgi:putative Holliday junction resolvase